MIDHCPVHGPPHEAGLCRHCEIDYAVDRMMSKMVQRFGNDTTQWPEVNGRGEPIPAELGEGE